MCVCCACVFVLCLFICMYIYVFVVCFFMRIFVCKLDFCDLVCMNVWVAFKDVFYVCVFLVPVSEDIFLYIYIYIF